MEHIRSLVVVRIVDDDAGVRDSYKFLIESDGWLVKTYASAEDFLNNDDLSVVGCAVLDVRMPGISGLELQDKLRSLSNQLPIIFISAHADIEMVVAAMQHGALNFLAKPIKDESLLNSIKTAVALDLERRKNLEERSDIESSWKLLSPREKQIALLICKGLLNKQIAGQLQIAERTVQVHRSHVFSKFQVRNAVQLSRKITSKKLGVLEL